MNFGANKAPVEMHLEHLVHLEVHLEELILEIFIKVLIISGIKNHGKNLMF